MQFLQIKETCIYFHDLEKARVFYNEKLELPMISYAKKKHTFFRVGSSVLLCFNPEDSKEKKHPPGHFAYGKYHFALEVGRDEYASYKSKIIEKGIDIIDTIIWKTGQESFYFEDTEGNVLEIVPEGIWK
jgi:catechol-2,3-dioxygenase